MENDVRLEVSNELQNVEVTSESYTQITVEDLEIFNTNVATGFLGVMAGLGVLTGCVVCIILKDIFKK